MEYFNYKQSRKFLDEMNKLNKTVVTIGNFDGVHKGHLNLINKVLELTETEFNECKSVVFTFNPHPKSFIQKSEFKVIFNSEERFEVFKELGIDIFIEYPFDEETRGMSGEDFVNKVLIEKLNCKALVVGNDYSFGKNKEGNVERLKELLSKHNVPVFVVPDILFENEKLGSTLIRKIIENGDMEKAEVLLNKPYFIIGEVIHGKELGRQIGFPTMNVLPSEDKLVPTKGVYISRVTIENEKYNAITNIGYNPTVDGDILITETNLFDFDKSIYGEVAKIEILKKLRDEKKFGSIEELKNQIDADVKFAKKFFNN